MPGSFCFNISIPISTNMVTFLVHESLPEKVRFVLKTTTKVYCFDTDLCIFMSFIMQIFLGYPLFEEIFLKVYCCKSNSRDKEIERLPLYVCKCLFEPLIIPVPIFMYVVNILAWKIQQ